MGNQTSSNKLSRCCISCLRQPRISEDELSDREKHIPLDVADAAVEQPISQQTIEACMFTNATTKGCDQQANEAAPRQQAGRRKVGCEENPPEHGLSGTDAPTPESTNSDSKNCWNPADESEEFDPVAEVECGSLSIKPLSIGLQSNATRSASKSRPFFPPVAVLLVFNQTLQSPREPIDPKSLPSCERLREDISGALNAEEERVDVLRFDASEMSAQINFRCVRPSVVPRDGRPPMQLALQLVDFASSSTSPLRQKASMEGCHFAIIQDRPFAAPTPATAAASPSHSPLAAARARARTLRSENSSPIGSPLARTAGRRQFDLGAARPASGSSTPADGGSPLAGGVARAFRPPTTEVTVLRTRSGIVVLEGVSSAPARPPSAAARRGRPGPPALNAAGRGAGVDATAGAWSSAAAPTEYFRVKVGLLDQVKGLGSHRVRRARSL